MRRAGNALVLALVLLGTALAGCTDRPAPAPHWETLRAMRGENACDTPTGKVLPLTKFDVDHQRLWANFTLTLTAGVIDFKLLNPFNTVAYSKRFTASGSDSHSLDEPFRGVWEVQVECPAGAAFNFQWDLSVIGLTRP